MLLHRVFLCHVMFALVCLHCCILRQISAHAVKDKDCPTCGKEMLTDSDVKKLRIMSFVEELKRKLQMNEGDFSEVAKLNLSKLPGPVVRKKFEDADNDFSLTPTEKIVITGNDAGHQCHKTNDTALGCFAFDMSGLTDLRIHSATLWVYKMKDDVDMPELILYDLKSNGSISELPAEDSIIFRSEMDRKNTKDNWVTMDLSHQAKKWMGEGADTRTLAIKCNTYADKHYKDMYGLRDGYRPLLVMSTSKPKKDRRQKRQFSRCLSTVESMCCREKLELKLTDYDLGYIRSPKKIDIGYCKGSCTAHFQSGTLNAFMRHDMLFYQPMGVKKKKRIAPCCVPKRKKTTHFLIHQYAVEVWTAVPDVLIDSCHCI